MSRTVAHVEVDGFAVAVVHNPGGWRCTELDAALIDDLDGLLTELRKLSAEGSAAFALVAVDEDFFAVIRPAPGGAALLISDVTAAEDFNLAADIADLLNVDVPDWEDVDDSWPAGAMGVLADFGLGEQEMQIIVDDDDLFPDEQLQLIADRCGFGDEFARLID